MALTAPLRLRVDEQSAVAAVRREARGMAARLGFDETAQEEAAIVATELSTNLLRHAGHGVVVLRPDGASGGLDVLAWDRGPGIGDVARSLHDGFSTAGGSGTGLGAVGRLALAFDVQSTPGRGTAVLARLGGVTTATPAVDGLALALEGETASGDGWAAVQDGSVLTIMLADGLGHGDDAARAAAAAMRELLPGISPEEQLERAHGALRSTRGAAAAVARLDLRSGALRFAGIGNIAAVTVTGGAAKALPSMNGTLGSRVERIVGYERRLEPGSLLVMHSDGARSGWDLAAYPGAIRRDPLLIAALLIRDFERGRDDVSAVVARVPVEAR
jgi:anti-sigma regulatory factor (Ser/Thr protein kinase)